MSIPADALFVPTITLDGVAAVLSILGGGIIFLLKTSNKLTILAGKVQEHGEKIDKLVGITEVQARHDERLIELTRRINLNEQRWEELRHGEGLVIKS